MSTTNKRDELLQIRESIRTFQEHEHKLMAELGERPGEAVGVDITADEHDAMTFDRMTPGERSALSQDNPERWEQLVKATEAVGMRKLLSS